MSRRKAEELIAAGRVSVGGKTVILGDRAEAGDEIMIDGKSIPEVQKNVYIMLNKPRGYVTTASDEKNRPTVMDLVSDVGIRVYPCGRLDMFSEGLLIMTNDGDLANRITHPSHHVYKEYLLKINYTAESAAVPACEALSKPMELDGYRLAPVICRHLKDVPGGCIISISIREGRNRQIRRMCEKCGYKVASLKRVAVGRIKLGDLPSGKWRNLNQEEIQYLMQI